MHVVEHDGRVFIIRASSAHQALIRFVRDLGLRWDADQPVTIRWVDGGTEGRCNGFAVYRLDGPTWTLRSARGNL